MQEDLAVDNCKVAAVVGNSPEEGPVHRRVGLGSLVEGLDCKVG